MILYDHGPVLSGIVLVVGLQQPKEVRQYRCHFCRTVRLKMLPLLPPRFRCRHQVDEKPRLPVGQLQVPVDVKVGQKVVVQEMIWGDGCHGDESLDNRCCSNCPRNHQSPVWE